MKLLSVRAISVAFCLVWALVFGLVSTVFAQTNYYSSTGSGYSIAGSLLGDQMFSDAAITSSNGFVVWQDNATDGDGWGISARRLDSTLSGTANNFRVNVTGTGDQEHPRIALLQKGGAVVVWQGGKEGYQHIFARFLTPTNTFLTTTDLVVSTFNNTNGFQVDPAVAVLNNSNVVIVWASCNQAGSNTLQDVYAKILSPTGSTVSNEFLVNQFISYNQRSPSVAALKSGGFVVAWVSEQQQSLAPVIESNTVYYASTSATVLPSVGIYGRTFQSSGAAAGGEFAIDATIGPDANPRIAASSDGSFMVAWSGRNANEPDNGWDVYARLFSSAGVGGTVVRINTYTYGQQFAPRFAAIGSDYLFVWTAVGQGGARQSIKGQFIHGNGSPVGSEFSVNAPTIAQQMQPIVASDGVGQFLTVWSGFTGVPYSFDLVAQRYFNVSSILQAMPAPCVWAPFVISNNVYQPQLVVSWSPVQGLSVTNYEVYVDGIAPPIAVVTSNSWIMTAANGLTKSSTRSFTVDYLTADGRRSPISPSASGTTWSGANYYGIPFEWMEDYYGLSFSSWPANVNAPLTPGGLSLYQLFVSGGNPLDPSTWMQQKLVKTSQGVFLNWNTQPGATYQVQVSTNLATWNNLDLPRFAAGTNDSFNLSTNYPINVGGGVGGYYRVVLMR